MCPHLKTVTPDGTTITATCEQACAQAVVPSNSFSTSRSHELAIGRTAFDTDPSIDPFQSSPRVSSVDDPALKPAAGVRVGLGHMADCSETMQDLARYGFPCTFLVLFIESC
jgi:hypothetical protein